MRKTLTWRRGPAVLLALLATVLLASSASQALGAVPHPATGESQLTGSATTGSASPPPSCPPGPGRSPPRC
ncbi:hypothetical protein N8J89_26985 [Crossiella sp. CA-258035]|uniref:hypothetical protein n=1 Tax=Crossiella sp. CA-258035 TaxID=2981138 RepID=UPI0024BC4F5B|nr:hypothetical protein [Crossiella sp. CA-258035]WHT16767.1 hypothetical protein N8J89_26985 [Crossiella sp. CA-258035]